MPERTREAVSIRYHPPGLGVAFCAWFVGGCLSVVVDLLRVVAVIQRGGPLTLDAVLAEGRVFHWWSVLVSALYCGVFVALYLGLLAFTEFKRRFHLEAR